MAHERRITPERAWPVSTAFRDRVNRLVAAYNAGRMDVVLTFFASDAVLIPADRPGVRGHEAIRKHFAEVFAEHIILVSLKLQRFVATGEVAVQQGRYHRRVPRDRGVENQFGECEAFWRRQPDGHYRITTLRFSTAALSDVPGGTEDATKMQR